MFLLDLLRLRLVLVLFFHNTFLTNTTHKHRYMEGRFEADTLVCADGSSDWLAISEVREAID